LRRVDLSIRRRRFRAARQQHTNDAQPKRHAQQKEHDPAHYPRRLFAALGETVPDRLEAVVGDEATFLDNIDANVMRIFVKLEKIEFD
jgi:hypothetical protein